MDLEKLILSEHSKAVVNKIVNYVGHDKQRFKKLMDLFLKGEYKVTQRAAWPFSYIALEHPDLIAPYFNQLIKKLEETGNHDSVARNIMRIFQDIDIPEKYHAQLIDICFKFLMNASNPAAVRVFSMTTAANISKKYPEIKKELLLVLEDMNSYPQQAAIASRLKHTLKALKGKH